MSHHCCHHHDHNHGCCGEGSCGCCCGHHHHSSCCGSMSQHADQCEAQHLLAVADQAWMEVLKEKIKEYIYAYDSKIDEIASIIAEANHAKWKQKIASKRQCSEYSSQLKGLFCGENCNIERKGERRRRRRSANGKEEFE